MDKKLNCPPVRSDGLQLQEHRGFQERYWFIQRIAWCGYLVIVIVALLGLTGSGGYLHKQTVVFKGATVELPRVSRWEGSDDMKVTFSDGQTVHDLVISSAFFDRFSVEQIRPEPMQEDAMADAQGLRFSASGDAPHKVWFDLRAMHFGWTSFRVQIGEETRTINLLVLP